MVGSVSSLEGGLLGSPGLAEAVLEGGLEDLGRRVVVLLGEVVSELRLCSKLR